ncbi:unnamed protein product [Ostreobium quekettii]|uniref:Uncharacterized protein n=1 Tax=Ostreobium quekettii TaxID=121088 RepID=A0A8S1J8C8_9CHLO|nr:unnamed protein product [Ostreobium quekettii]|eukprot:evm.model.scf_119EXC.14 EVM.evm.TU.scf_119EXC.14   scf_119EXC:92819-94573(-)
MADVGGHAVSVHEYARQYVLKITHDDKYCSPEECDRAGRSLHALLRQLAQDGDREDVRMTFKTLKCEFGSQWRRASLGRRGEVLTRLFAILDVVHKECMKNSRPEADGGPANSVILEEFRLRVAKMVTGETWEDCLPLRLAALKHMHKYAQAEGDLLRQTSHVDKPGERLGGGKHKVTKFLRSVKGGTAMGCWGAAFDEMWLKSGARLTPLLLALVEENAALQEDLKTWKRDAAAQGNGDAPAKGAGKGATPKGAIPKAAACREVPPNAAARKDPPAVTIEGPKAKNGQVRDVGDCMPPKLPPSVDPPSRGPGPFERGPAAADAVAPLRLSLLRGASGNLINLDNVGAAFSPKGQASRLMSIESDVSDVCSPLSVDHGASSGQDPLVVASNDADWVSFATDGPGAGPGRTASGDNGPSGHSDHNGHNEQGRNTGLGRHNGDKGHCAHDGRSGHNGHQECSGWESPLPPAPVMQGVGDSTNGAASMYPLPTPFGKEQRVLQHATGSMGSAPQLSVAGLSSAPLAPRSTASPGGSYTLGGYQDGPGTASVTYPRQMGGPPNSKVAWRRYLQPPEAFETLDPLKRQA